MLKFLDSLFQLMIDLVPSLVILFVMISVVVFMGYVARLMGRNQIRTIRRRRVTSAALVGMLEASEREGISLGEMFKRMAWLNETPLKGEMVEIGAAMAQGDTMGRVLERHPDLVEPRVANLIRLGERVENYAGVVPLCRRCLTRASSHHGAVYNSILLVPMVIAAFVVMFAAIVIAPKFTEIRIAILEGDAVSGSIEHLRFGLWGRHVWQEMTKLPSDTTVALLALCLVVAFFLIMFLFADGPQMLARRSGWGRWMRRAWDLVAMCLPWHRKRVARDFTEVLVLLLDAGVTEAEAVALAAQSTGSVLIEERAQRAVHDLQSGRTLAAALARFDRKGDLCWRFENAARSTAGLTVSLRAWLEVMEAEAWKSESRASQIVTTLAVLLTGAVVMVVCVRLFFPIVEMVEAGALW